MKGLTINKKKLGAISAVALSLCILGSLGSYSYFSDQSSVTNDFTTGSMDIKVTESQWKNSEDGKNIYPGYTTEKNPTIQNITGMEDNDAYVAAYIRAVDYNGNIITDSHRLDLIYHMIRYDAESNNKLEKDTKYSDSIITSIPNFNPAFELQKRDDATGSWLYYLKDTLDSTADPDTGETATLFTKLAVPTEWSQDELDVLGDFKIIVEYKCIQAATFENVYDAMNVLLNSGMDIHQDYNENDINRSGEDGKVFTDKNHSEDANTISTVSDNTTPTPAPGSGTDTATSTN